MEIKVKLTGLKYLGLVKLGVGVAQIKFDNFLENISLQDLDISGNQLTEDQVKSVVT